VTRYPDPDTLGLVNIYDYEQLTYDDNSNVTYARRRDGQLFYNSYDDIGRLTTRNAPGTQPDVGYTYDNFGRLLTAFQSGMTLSYTYDQLSRLTSEAGAIGTVNYDYDAAGRRTKLTYPSTLYVNYDYDNTGAMTAVRES